MPVDPEISLDAGRGVQPINPLGLAQSVAQTQQALVQARTAQQEFAARQLAGSILSQAPDLQTGLQLIQKNPITAAFAPQIVSSAVGTYNSFQSGVAGDLKNAHDAFSGAISQLSPYLANPTDANWDTVQKTALGLTPVSLRDKLTGNLSNVRQAIDASATSDDPNVAQQQRTKQAAAWMVANGSAPAVGQILSTYKPTDVGGRIVNVATPPPQGSPTQAPGAMALGPNALTVGPESQLGAPRSIPFGPTGGQLIGPGGAQLQNFLTPEAPAPSRQPAAAAPTNIPSGAAPAPPPTGTTMSSLGRPLFTPATPMPAQPTFQRDLAGNPTGLEGERAADLMKDFTTTGKAVYNSAVATQGQIAEMTNDYDTMANHGGFLVPGTGAPIRLALGRALTTLQSALGQPADDSASKVAAGEDFQKATQRMAGALLQTMYGQQREAAETIRNITDKGVPGISNTLMGGRMLLGMVGAVSNRISDEYQWNNEWASRHNGDLRGADIAFNQAFPAKDYVNDALGKLGMTSAGFTKQGLQRARQQGLVTKQQFDYIKAHNGAVPESIPGVGGQ